MTFKTIPPDRPTTRLLAKRKITPKRPRAHDGGFRLSARERRLTREYTRRTQMSRKKLIETSLFQELIEAQDDEFVDLSVQTEQDSINSGTDVSTIDSMSNRSSFRPTEQNQDSDSETKFTDASQEFRAEGETGMDERDGSGIDEGSEQDGFQTPHESQNGLTNQSKNSETPRTRVKTRNGKLNYCVNCSCEDCCQIRSEADQSRVSSGDFKRKRPINLEGIVYAAGEGIDDDALYERKLKDIIYYRYRNADDRTIVIHFKAVFGADEGEEKRPEIALNLATLRKCRRYKKVMRRYLKNLGPKALSIMIERYPELGKLIEREDTEDKSIEVF